MLIDIYIKKFDVLFLRKYNLSYTNFQHNANIKVYSTIGIVS